MLFNGKGIYCFIRLLMGKIFHVKRRSAPLNERELLRHRVSVGATRRLTLNGADRTAV